MYIYIYIYQVGSKDEACSVWLEHRKIRCDQTNTSVYHSLLSRALSQLSARQRREGSENRGGLESECLVSTCVTDTQRCVLDCICLQYWGQRVSHKAFADSVRRMRRTLQTNRGTPTVTTHGQHTQQ